MSKSPNSNTPPNDAFAIPTDLKAGDVITNTEDGETATVLWFGTYLGTNKLLIVKPTNQESTDCCVLNVALLPTEAIDSNNQTVSLEHTVLTEDDIISMQMVVDVVIPTPMIVDLVLNLVASEYYKRQSDALLERIRTNSAGGASVH